MSSLLAGADPNLVFSLIVGLAVAVGVGAVIFALGGIYDPVRRRAREVASGDVSAQAATKTTLTKFLDPLQDFAPQPTKQAEIGRMRLLLMQAGYRDESALAYFYAIKTVLCVLAIVGVWIYSFFTARYTLSDLLYFSAIAAGIGLFLPNMVLARMALNRKTRILNGFPDALDLLVSCSEAGLGLNAALQRVGTETAVSCPPLAEELGLVNAEIRAGVERIKALRDLVDRTGLDEIRGLVSMLSQSLRFGTSVAESLRVYSEEFRDKRMQRAEEEAAKIGTKMLFPLVVCFFPSFFLIAVGPAIISIMQAFKDM